MGFKPQTEKYFEELSNEIKRNYDVAGKARARGLDPVDKVEVPLAMTMAAKVVRLISTVYPQLDREDVIERLLELEKQYGALECSVSFKIAEEIASEKYCKFENKMQAMDAGIRVAFSYLTLGVVSSPIEGFTEIKEGFRQDGKKYLKAYFSGPIRSAGTTASCMVLMVIDYIRQVFGYEKFDPTEQECKRIVMELNDYHERVTNLQYLPTEEEAYFIAKNMPIQVDGDPTEKREVSNFKDLPRIDTNFIRGGLCLILGEGMAQKAAKGLRLLKKVQKNGFQIKDWEWLDEYVHMHEKRTAGKADTSPTYIKDLVAGRPVFGHPGKGFRFRYGRSRVAGFSAVSVHPATMGITNDFIATGTQLKIEKPTKGCVVTPCDVIEGPIVKLKNGSVKKLKTYEEAKELYKDVEEIIYIGDILFPLGDVMNRNATLIKSAYVEEWWNLELEKLGGKVKNSYEVSFEDAKELSRIFGVALSPKYIYYWTQINYEHFLGFIDWLNHSRVNVGKLLFPYNSHEKERFKIGKRTLELLGIEHEIGVENVILNEIDTKALLINLGFDSKHEGELNLNFDFKKLDLVFQTIDDKELRAKSEGNFVLGIINKLSKFKIRDKAGEFIGSRMGRPEKAKLRKLIGSPNVLFPVGEEGGRLRSVNEAVIKGYVDSSFPFFYCEKCNKESIYGICSCGSKTKRKYFCRVCNKEIEGKKCEIHNSSEGYKKQRIEVGNYLEVAKQKLGYSKNEMPVQIKGVRGTSSTNHDIENLVKGVLRAKYNLCVNKDGTVRYDMTELPVSHFKPLEIEVSVEKLRSLGYEKDIFGNVLENEEQILELKPHDIIIPCNGFCGDEKADDVFINVSNFLDELLEKFYGLPKFYNIKKKEDLVGQLGVCMAPHNCAGVICRIIGFSKVQGLLASAYMHAAMRRDCVHPNTGMIYEKNGVVNHVKIGSYIEKLIKRGNKTKQIDSYGTIRVELDKDEKNFYAYGIDIVTHKLVKKKIKYFIKSKNPEYWTKIITKSGREQIMTPTHDFFYLDKNNKFQIKKAKEINIGDKIAILRKYKNFVGTQIFDKEFGKRKLMDEINFESKGDYFIDEIIDVKEYTDDNYSYCFDIINTERLDKNVLWGEGIINFRCDGDEAALMLLLDVLINFSRTFLPSHRGGTQDAPLVLNGRVYAKEVDDQILDFELVNSYPLELYEKAEQKLHSNQIEIEMVKQRINKGEDPFCNTGFTHDTSDFNMGCTCSSYKTLPTMKDKVEWQMDLCTKLRSVDQGDVARLIIDRHFMKDLKGNLRKFSQQNFRCGKCNEIFRRPPLNGKCTKCGNPKLIFTISYGSIVKYLEPALDLVKHFDVPAYINQDLELVKKYIESIFGKETEKQENMSKWF
ncbi:DNA polymerase II large subunit [Candidatus Pacearchaeota archaeon]|nr:DNA polymerase II large subunit [Candidatus Pacearchaeota archaeon]